MGGEQPSDPPAGTGLSPHSQALPEVQVTRSLALELVRTEPKDISIPEILGWRTYLGALTQHDKQVTLGHFGLK